VLENQCSIPGWVNDLDSFRRWFRSDQFPNNVRVDFLADTIWVDLPMEEFFTHNQVKGEFSVTLGGIVKEHDLGRYIHDRMRITHHRAGLSAEPDGAFASWATLQAKRLRLVPRNDGRVMELEGTPDMVLKVMSPSSVGKDDVILRGLYWKAGVPEFWLVDVRSERVRFEILRHASRSYAHTKAQKGWLRSEVFEREFRLSRQVNRLGDPQYTLSVR
jgi:Uma2 family endonuclease